MKLDEYSHEFKGKKAEEVFDGIMLWLKNERAEVEGSSRPTQIEAVHGSRKTVSVWKRNARKKLEFSINAISDGVKVDVKTSTGSMMYADDVGTWRPQIYVNYGLLLEEIWASVDGVPSNPRPEQDAPVEPPEPEKKSKWKLFK